MMKSRTHHCYPKRIDQMERRAKTRPLACAPYRRLTEQRQSAAGHSALQRQCDPIGQSAASKLSDWLRPRHPLADPTPPCLQVCKTLQLLPVCVCQCVALFERSQWEEGKLCSTEIRTSVTMEVDVPGQDTCSSYTAVALRCNAPVKTEA